MTFLDALRAGRGMRRRGWWRGNGGDRWLVLDPDGAWRWDDGSPANGPRRGDMLAGDWEVSGS